MFLSRISSKLLKNSVKITKTVKTINVQTSRPCSSSATTTENLISLYNLRKTIKAAGRELEEGATCIQTTCPVCCFDSQRPAEKIYINKITGNFVCPACQHKGTWSLVEKFFTAPKKSPNTNELKKYQELFLESQHKHQPKLPSNLITISSYGSDKLDDIADHFNLQLPSSCLLRLSDALYDELTKTLYIPLVDVDGRTTGYKLISKSADSTIVEKTIPEHNASGVIVVNGGAANARLASKDAILVLNIFDVLALSTQKIKETIVCLPYGMKNLPQECLPALERYQKLFLWFNYDTVGWDTARNYGKKLDEKRCMFVRPMESSPTPYNALVKGLDLKVILSKAQPILHKAITTFSSLRQDVLSELQNRDKALGVKWKRYPVLNKLIKGLRKGELTILTGPTGCGKTTFMSEYSLDLALQGVNTLWGSFEIRNTRLASTLLRQLAGRPLDNNLADFDYWADQFERLPMYFMTFHGQQPIKIVMDAIEHAQYVHDIHHVIIDNVQFMMGMSDEGKHNDRFWKQDAIISSFRAFATRKNCHVTLVIHPRKEREDDDLTTSSIFGSAKATQEADNVLIIQDKRLTSLRGKKYLQVAKNRYSGDLGIMPLDFDKLGLSYAQKKKKVEATGSGDVSVSEESG